MTQHTPGTVAERSAGRGAGVQLGVGILGLGVLAALVWQFFEVYFAIGSPLPEADPSDGVRYLVTAGIGVSAAVVSVVLSLIRAKLTAFLCSVVLAVVLLGAAYVLAVPQHRWNPAPARQPLPADYQPCFSGSGDCPGG